MVHIHYILPLPYTSRNNIVYTQTSAFSYSHKLLYLHNRINNYKKTTKSAVCVNYDYATGFNTAVIQFSWHITEQFYNFTQP